MAQFIARKPEMKEIKASQDSDISLRRQQAKDYYYSVGNRWHFIGVVIASILALSSPLVLIFKPDLGPLLGAVAGAWIFTSRLLFEPLKRASHLKGATVQELFDCEVLGLQWNDALVAKLSDEEINSASKEFDSLQAQKRHKNWYPADNEASWPISVLICQRSNAVWARRQHHAYGIFLIVLALSWGLIGILIAMIADASLSQYLTTIALPSLPALLDATELAQKHLGISEIRHRLERKIDDLMLSESTHNDLRELQDQIFELRRDAPPVAELFYKVLAKNYEQDMRYAASQITKGSNNGTISK